MTGRVLHTIFLDYKIELWLHTAYGYCPEFCAAGTPAQPVDTPKDVEEISSLAVFRTVRVALGGLAKRLRRMHFRMYLVSSLNPAQQCQ